VEACRSCACYSDSGSAQGAQGASSPPSFTPSPPFCAAPTLQFGHQEPGSESEISSFCSANYGITFPLFAKVEVGTGGWCGGGVCCACKWALLFCSQRPEAHSALARPKADHADDDGLVPTRSGDDPLGTKAGKNVLACPLPTFGRR